MAGRYATDTTVSVENSRAEIERILTRYGAEQFAYGWEAGSAELAFRMKGRKVRFVLPLPDRKSPKFTQYKQGSSMVWRVESAATKLWEQACRQRYRALALCIKAKLEAVEVGITTFDDEFLAHIVLPNGEMFGEWAKPQVAQAYLSGGMPRLLLAAGATN